MATFNDHFKDLLNLVAKRVLGREHTSDIPIDLEGAYRPYNQITPFDKIEDTGLSEFKYTSGIRKSNATQPEVNLFSFSDNISDNAQGRIATIYGIKEVSYSDTDGSDVGYVADNYRFIHRTFDFPDQGVSAGDVMFVPLTGRFYVSDAVITGDPPNTGLQFPVDTFSEPTFTFGSDIDVLILQRNAVQLFTVSGPNVEVGREQTFFMVTPDVVQNPSPYLADLNLLSPKRLRPLMPHRKSTKIDSIFTKGVLGLKSDWDFMLVLYPDDGAGNPDYTKPIIGPRPIIDSSISDEQEMIIDHMNGSVHFTVPPRPGDEINPNAVTGAPLKLWAIFATITMGTSVSQTNSNSLVRGVSDFNPVLVDDKTSTPSYFRYDQNRKIWSLFSGEKYLETDPANQPAQGFEVGELGVEKTNRAGFRLNPENETWEVCSIPSDSDFIPLRLTSGEVGGTHPGISVDAPGYTGGFFYNSGEDRWGLDKDLYMVTAVEELGSDSLPNSSNVKVAVSGNFAYIIRNVSGDGFLYVYDISDPNAIVMRDSEVVAGREFLDIDISGTNVFVLITNEIQVYNVSNPDSISLTDGYPAGSDVYFQRLKVIGDYVYVVVLSYFTELFNWGSSLWVLDFNVTTADELTYRDDANVLGPHDPPGPGYVSVTTTDVSIIATMMYKEVLYTIDVTDPDSVSVLDSVVVTDGTEVDVERDIVAVLCPDESIDTLRLFDISNPSSIQVRDTTTSGLDSPVDVIVSRGYVWVANSGDMTLLKFSAVNPLNIVLDNSYIQTGNGLLDLDLNNSKLAVLTSSPTTDILKIYNEINTQVQFHQIISSSIDTDYLDSETAVIEDLTATIVRTNTIDGGSSLLSVDANTEITGSLITNGVTNSGIVRSSDSNIPIQGSATGSYSSSQIVGSQLAPWGVDIDYTTGKVYWASYGRSSGQDIIQRANLDGTNVETIIGGLQQPYALELDVPGGKVYWSDMFTNGIHRADLDGSNTEQIITGQDEPRDIALDLVGGKVYWTESAGNVVRRANLNGSSVETLVSGLSQPQGIAVDPANGKMYYSDETLAKIVQANLDGSSPVDILTTIDARNLVVRHNKLFISEYVSDRIRMSNLDGSNLVYIKSGVNLTPCGIGVRDHLLVWTSTYNDNVSKIPLVVSGILGEAEDGYGGYFFGTSTRAPIHVEGMSALPSSAMQGDIAVRDSDNTVHIYLNSAWRQFTVT